MAEFNNLLDQSMILDRQDLTSTEKLVAVVILSFRNSQNGRCNPPVASKTPGKSSICTRTGLSRACVLNAIQSLEKKNVFVIQREVGQTSNFICRGVYEVDTGVNVVDALRGVNDVDTGVYEVDTGGKRSRPEGSTSYTHNKEITNKEQINNKEEKESESFSLTPDEEKPKRITKASLKKPSDSSVKVFSDWVDFKRKVSKAISQYMIDAIVREAKKAGISTEQAMVWQMESGYQGFKADWYLKDQSQRTQSAPAQKKPEPKKELGPDDFTDKQISFFAYKLSRYQPFGSKYGQGCDSYDTFATKIEGWLRHPRNFLECLPYLKELHLVN